MTAAAWPVHLADLALTVLALEAAWLAVQHRAGRHVHLAEWAPTLVSGACLLLALRFALAAAPWPWWAAALSVGGVAHATDLVLRWRRVRPS